jgi:hypothetical protein
VGRFKSPTGEWVKFTDVTALEAEVQALREKLTQRSAPVSDEEWQQNHQVESFHDNVDHDYDRTIDYIDQDGFNAIIEERRKGPQWEANGVKYWTREDAVLATRTAPKAKEEPDAKRD